MLWKSKRASTWPHLITAMHNIHTTHVSFCIWINKDLKNIVGRLPWFQQFSIKVKKKSAILWNFSPGSFVRGHTNELVWTIKSSLFHLLTNKCYFKLDERRTVPPTSTYVANPTIKGLMAELLLRYMYSHPSSIILSYPYGVDWSLNSN